MSITLVGFIHIIITVIMLTYSMAYRNTLTLSTSLALVLIFYYEYKSFLGIRENISSIVIRRVIDKNLVNELEEVDIKIVIENKSRISLPRVTLIDVVPKFIETRPTKPTFKIVVPSGLSIEVKYKARPLTPGVHDFQSVLIVFSDALGFFSEEREISCRESVVALPLSTMISIKLKSIQRILGVAVKGKAIGGAYDLANIRDYVVGDDHRKILWRVYARTGKLMVREDFGETAARALVLIDIRKHMWYIGSPPNTLAQIQLRYARSLIEYLARNKCVVDIALCSGLVPKVARNAERSMVEAVYNLISVLPTGEGCESPVSVFTDSIKHLGRTSEQYDIIILITNPISIALEYGIDDLKKLLALFAGKIVLAIPRFNYEAIVSKEKLEALLKELVALVENIGLGIELSDEELSVALLQVTKA